MISRSPAEALPGCEESPTQHQPGYSEGLERSHPGPGGEQGDINSSILIQNSHINYSSISLGGICETMKLDLLYHFHSVEKWSGEALPLQ